jgi:hypothetical protein
VRGGDWCCYRLVSAMSDRKRSSVCMCVYLCYYRMSFSRHPFLMSLCFVYCTDAIFEQFYITDLIGLVLQCSPSLKHQDTKFSETVVFRNVLIVLIVLLYAKGLWMTEHSCTF